MLFLVCYLVDSDILNKITKNQQSYKFMHSTFSDRIFCYLKTEKQWNKRENDIVYNIEIQIIDKTLIIS